ncbi:sirohydrochlorin chelatase [Streptomyces sp. IBSBF 2435]|uniref:sirohydrochlorin chelatase n=1 Tax=Streptomyces sp. IBSBF 2435 TaxID=2903531 RepID=UPI002FDBD96C
MTSLSPVRGHFRPTLVAVAHGSRDPRALPAVRTLLERVRAARPGVDVRLGHVELNEPLLADTLAALRGGRGRGEVVLVPLLLSRGHHVKHDLPAALAAAPWLHGTVAAPLGPHPLLTDVLHARLQEAGWPAPDTEPAAPGTRAATPAAVVTGQALSAGSSVEVGRTAPSAMTAPTQVRPAAAATRFHHPGTAVPRPAAVVLAAAGSRDADSGRDTVRAAALLAGRLGVPVVPAYASAAAPSVPDAVDGLAALGIDPRRIAVASYFTAPGRFAGQTAAAAPWIAAAPLGPHEAMARLVLHRYDEAARALRTSAAPPRPFARAS